MYDIPDRRYTKILYSGRRMGCLHNLYPIPSKKEKYEGDPDGRDGGSLVLVAECFAMLYR